MSDEEFLAARFEEHRPRLRAVATRVLGSAAEGDDAVQEAWLRLSRADPAEVANLGGWLTTVVARVALNMLRSRGRLEPRTAVDHTAEETDPAGQAELADSVGLALLVVLDTLSPAERLAFVLHDLFAVPFEEIAPIVDRTATATRKLASRARQRVRGATPGGADLARRRELVAAFLAASRDGDFDALLALLDPDVVLRPDAAAVAFGARSAAGARAVAGNFTRRARAAHLAVVDGVPGLAWIRDGVPRVVFAMTITAGRVSAIDMLADPDHLARLDLETQHSPE
ncbi:sigma-70 family RNA polymerase sigma factor [Actinophytocola sediminis]